MRDRPHHEPSGHTKDHKARRYTVTVHSPTYTRVTFWKDRRKSNFAQVATKYAYGQLLMYKPAKNPYFKTTESEWSQHNYRVTCVIAQKHSSATFVSFRFRSGKEKNSVRFKNVNNSAT